MSNFQVYKKTILFSIVSFLVDLLVLGAMVGLAALGFYLMDAKTDKALIGLFIGLAVGIVIAAVVKILITNRIKAAQIAMMTMGVTEGSLPENTFSAGFAEVKDRFASITLFFMVTGAIKGMFRQIGRAVNRVGTAIGGDTGNAVTSAIDSAIQTVISYLCDCCLGWVMYRKKEGVAKAACEGAVIFFKHGKTLIRNIGRIFGMGLLSLVIVGGGFFGIAYLISKNNPNLYNMLVEEIKEIGVRTESDIPDFLLNPTYLMYIVSGIVGLIFFSLIHSLLVRPFILVGVLRNFMAAGLKEEISEKDFEALDNRSKRFAKLHQSF